MGRIELRTEIAASAQRCFDLSRDIDLHMRSVAFSQEVAIAGVTSGLIGPGEFVTWEARHLGRRWRMTTRITEFDPPHRFVDEAEAGPFNRFRHEHSFEERGSRTRMTDRLEFELRWSVLGAAAGVLVAGPYLRRLLQLRNRTIKDVAENGPDPKPPW